MNIIHLALKYFGGKARYEVGDIVERALTPVGPYIRQMGLGMACLVLGVVCFVFTFIFLLAALFFYFVPNFPWSQAAFWTGLISGGVGAAFVVGAVSFLKKPFRP